MANGPLGGNMGSPPIAPQPPQVSFTTTAESRGGFNNFLNSIPSTMNTMPPINPMGAAPTAPMGGNPMGNIDIFNQPPSMGMGMMGMNQPPMNPMMQQPIQPPMMNQQPMMMEDGGGVPPRQTEIMGQPHMLSYITPEEGGILQALGGSGRPGPMGIPSYYSDESGADSEAGEAAAGDTSSDNESNNNDGNDGYDYSDDDNYQDSGYDITDAERSANQAAANISMNDINDNDMDYRDSYTPTELQKATNIGRNVYGASINPFDDGMSVASQNVDRTTGAGYSTQMSPEAQANYGLSLEQMNNIEKSTRGQQAPSVSNAVQAAAIQGKSGNDRSGIDFGINLDLGPDVTPTVASVSPTSVPGFASVTGMPGGKDVTGFNTKGPTFSGDGKDTKDYGNSGAGRDVSDFTTADQVEAFSEKMNQKKEGYFPGLDNLGFIGKGINTISKNVAQSVIDNYNKGFAPTYDQKSGQITGTSDYGIGMGMPSSNKRAGEGFGMEQGPLGNLFGTGKTVPGYDVFDATSPSIGMYNRTPADTSGDGGDPLILRRPLIKEEEEEDDGIPNVIGGGDPITLPASGPVVVDSPFTSNVGDFTPSTFSAGDINALIARLTGMPAPKSMNKGGVAGYAEGGLISAVDNFLASAR